MKQNREILRVERLTKRYGRRTVLRELSFSLEEGQTLAITGKSGVGKTTLLSILGAIERPSSGAVYFGGERLRGFNSRRCRRKDIGFVFQDSCLIEELTALENVRCAMRLAGQKGDPMRYLAFVGLEDRSDQYPNTLSGGEARRVSVARALAKQPKLLLLDEPTQGLDPEAAAELLELILRLSRQCGISVVMVTHDPALAGRLERRLRLIDGRLAEETER